MSFNPDNEPYNNPSVSRKVAFITGGHSGIGFYTVLHLYLHGYDVYLVGRSRSKMEEAIINIKKEAEKRRESQFEKDNSLKNSRFLGKKLDIIMIDLLDLKSVEDGIKDFISKEDKLDLLINNAGIMGQEFELTKDNFDIQLQTSYISHFLITNRLLPLLKKSIDNDHEHNKLPLQQPRIINLSSIAHIYSFKYFPMDSTFNYKPTILFTWFRYSNAKLAEIHATEILAKKYPDILSLVVHPGIIMETKLWGHWRDENILGKYLYNPLFNLGSKLFGVTTEEGSYATLKAALSPSLTTEKDNGKYFVTLGVEQKASGIARNMDYATTTWKWTNDELEKRGYHLDWN